jgi:hypothetical protein
LGRLPNLGVDAKPCCGLGHLTTSFHLELGQHRGDVMVHRAPRKEQAPGDLVVAKAT